MHTAAPEVPPHYRAAGALMVTSGLTNLMFGAIWFLSLIWMCVGIYWLIPMALAVGEMIVGGLAASGVRMRFARAAAVIGAVNGLLLFNVYGVTMQGVAFVLQTLEPVTTWLALEETPP